MLDGMNKKFSNPYVIFYPVVSRDGMAFPVNRCLKEIQGQNFRESLAWRGNLIIAKCRDDHLSALIDASMADFPILKIYLAKHHPPMVSSPVSRFLHLHYPIAQPSRLITSPHIFFWISWESFSHANFTSHPRAFAASTRKYDIAQVLPHLGP